MRRRAAQRSAAQLLLLLSALTYFQPSTVACSGPSSINPATGKRYATTFPLITVEDMVHAQVRRGGKGLEGQKGERWGHSRLQQPPARPPCRSNTPTPTHCHPAQFKLLDHLGIDKLHAAVGSSLGGMQSLAASALYPERVGSCVSISAGNRAHPTAIALRYMQRRIIMSDPHWRGGDYYDHKFPVLGMKHAR